MIDGLFAFIVAALPPCAAEDSRNCVWDAQTRGNGIGTSFATVGPESAALYLFQDWNCVEADAFHRALVEIDPEAARGFHRRLAVICGDQ